MTPLLPTPDHYLYNLIAMTTSEAKRLWRRSIKEYFGKTCVYCGETYELHELTRALKCTEIMKAGFTFRPGSRVEVICHDIVPIVSIKNGTN